MTKKEKWLYDMTPVCKNCGKEAPVNVEMSTKEWKVYVTKNPCECGCETWVNRCDFEENDNATY